MRMQDEISFQEWLEGAEDNGFDPSPFTQAELLAHYESIEEEI